MSRLDRLVSAVPIIGSRFRRMRSAEEQLRKINPGHYYSVVPSVAEIEAEGGLPDPVMGDALPGIPLGTSRQLEVLHELSRFLCDSPLRSRANGEGRYHADNEWFQETDATLLHTLLRHLKPRRIVEIGGGYSTLVILDTIDQQHFPDPHLHTIEPFADRLRSGLDSGDLSRITLTEKPLQNVAASLFSELADNDVLFIDSSHVSKCGSDVNRIFFDVLPALAPGVWIHFHDIFFPFRYPRKWIERGQYWNETYLLRSFLLFNRAFEIVIWGDYLNQRKGEALAKFSSHAYQDIVGSFWMRRV